MGRGLGFSGAARVAGAALGSRYGEGAQQSANQLGGAALDAHRQEPLPADSPLWDMPNVIISPHNASASTGNEPRSAEMFVANFGHWVRGEAMFNVQRF